MRLEQRDKELAAIGASVGANCRPCFEHHIAAARAAGLSEAELAASVRSARTVRDQSIALLASRIDELLGAGARTEDRARAMAGSRDEALVALGASVGANSHALLEAHIATAGRLGLSSRELASALAMAEHVVRRAAEMTAAKATEALEEVQEEVPT